MIEVFGILRCCLMKQTFVHVLLYVNICGKTRITWLNIANKAAVRKHSWLNLILTTA